MKASQIPEYRNRLLSILVRAPEEGYSTKAICKHIFDKGSIYHLEHILNSLEYPMIWHDEGRIGLIEKPKYYKALPLEVVVGV